MPESKYLSVSRAALEANARRVCEYVKVPVIGVVKCDGYGVSVEEAAAAWKKAGVTMFAVAQPEEALSLRRAGFREDILLMAPVAQVRTLRELVEQDIILTVTSMDYARLYSSLAEEKPLRVHVAVDTGMGRFGIRWTDMTQLQSVYRMPGLRFEGIFSHFSKSFEKKCRVTQVQLERFLKVTSELTQAGYSLGTRHIANSCAALRFPQTRLDAVRVGSALVGRLCGPSPVELKQVGQLHAQVVDCKFFQPGDTTGYAGVCRMKRYTRAVVVAIGHEDGFGMVKQPDRCRLRDLAAWFVRCVKNYVNRPCVFYQGTALPVIGRIGTQYTLFDARDLEIPTGEYVMAQVDLLHPHVKRFT